MPRLHVAPKTPQDGIGRSVGRGHEAAGPGGTLWGMPYSDDIRGNVDHLEQRAQDAAQQEMERATTLDQKSAGLFAGALVVIAAGIAFVANLDGIHVGSGAKTLWAILLIVALVLALISLGLATAAMIPRAYRVVIHIDALTRWPTPRFLDRDPTSVRGELMMASLGAVEEARPINKTKGNFLGLAFGFFAAAMLATVILTSAVALRLAEEPKHHVPPRRHVAVKSARTTGAGATGRAATSTST